MAHPIGLQTITGRLAEAEALLHSRHHWNAEAAEDCLSIFRSLQRTGKMHQAATLIVRVGGAAATGTQSYRPQVRGMGGSAARHLCLPLTVSPQDTGCKPGAMTAGCSVKASHTAENSFQPFVAPAAAPSPGTKCFPFLESHGGPCRELPRGAARAAAQPRSPRSRQAAEEVLFSQLMERRPLCGVLVRLYSSWSATTWGPNMQALCRKLSKCCEFSERACERVSPSDLSHRRTPSSTSQTF